MTRRPQVMFLVALLGVVVLFGVVAHALGGTWALAAYAVVVVGLLLAGARRARALLAPPGRTCSCCTSTVHDPVRVI